jgi:O-antigen ligase
LPVLAIRRIIIVLTTSLILASFLGYGWLIMNHGGLSLYGAREIKSEVIIFGRANTAGAVILMLGLWNLISVLGEESRYRWISFGNLIMALVVLVGISSYAALAGYLVALCFIGLSRYYIDKRPDLPPFFSVVIFGGIAVVFLVFYSGLVEKIADNYSLYTLNGRTFLWSRAWGIIQEGAWLKGIGAGGWYGFYSNSGILGLGPGGVHNALLQSWVEGGIIELGLQFLLFFWLILVGLRSKCVEGIVLVGALIGIFTRNLAESNDLLFGLYTNFWVFLSWFVLISLVALVDKHESGNRPRGGYAGHNVCSYKKRRRTFSLFKRPVSGFGQTGIRGLLGGDK